MNVIRSYRIQVSGQVAQDEVNARSPLEVTAEKVSPNATLLAVRTDQSGLIGLMRHLHGLGFVLLSVDREP